MRADFIMTKAPVAVTVGATIEEAAARMAEANVGALPVLGAGDPCGIITDRDIAIRGVAMGKGVATQVGEISTLPAISVPPDASVDDVAMLMKQHQIRRILVVDGDLIEGIISLADIALARRRLASDVLSVISKPSNVRVIPTTSLRR